MSNVLLIILSVAGALGALIAAFVLWFKEKPKATKSKRNNSGPFYPEDLRENKNPKIK